MSWWRGLAAALVSCAVLTGGGVAAAQVRHGVTARQAAVPSWGRAQQLPGTETMSRQSESNDGQAFVGTGITSISCPARGDCAASGGFVNEGFNFLVFTAGEHAGKWAKAAVLPGDAALVGNAGDASVDEMITSVLSQVSCSAPGTCAVAGNYQVNGAPDDTRPLVSSERAGVWGKVHPVPGNNSALLTVSCPAAAGNCAAAGVHDKAAVNQSSPFVVGEKNGTWGQPQAIAGAAQGIIAISCPAAGTCLAGGFGATAFLTSEQKGTWGPARAVPGLSSLTTGRSNVDSVSCAAVGNCAIGGSYVDKSGHAQVFVADVRGGLVGQAQQLPGLAAMSKGGTAELTQLSCGSAGSCAAGGSYLSMKGLHHQQAWVAIESHGHWGNAVEVPGTASLNSAGSAAVDSVSCAASGCAAGGYYTVKTRTRPQIAFLVAEQGGSWHAATQVPGLAALNTGGAAAVNSVSCAPSGWCAAVGDYLDLKTQENRMFAVSER